MLLHCIYAPDIKEGLTQKVRRDFSQTLTELLGENYFSAFDRWCRSYGLELRAQSCYGVWAEMAQVSGYISYPETERWLGYSPMAPLFSEELGTRVPSWNLVAPVLTAVSRQQWFLRQGVPVVELAVYRHSDWEDRLHPDYLSDDALDRLGYSYDFVSPSQLTTEKAAVADGRLFPQGSAYKALILIDQKHLPADVSQTILNYAAAELPMIFIGEIPEESSYLFPKNGDEIVRRNTKNLLAYENVIRVENVQQAALWLCAHGLVPDVQPDAPTALLTAHRKADIGDLYYLLRQRKQGRPKKTSIPDEPFCSEITVCGTGNVYQLEPWNGKLYRLPFRADSGTVRFELQLAGNDAALIMVSEEEYPASTKRDPQLAAGILGHCAVYLAAIPGRPFADKNHDVGAAAASPDGLGAAGWKAGIGDWALSYEIYAAGMQLLYAGAGADPGPVCGSCKR